MLSMNDLLIRIDMVFELERLLISLKPEAVCLLNCLH